MIYYCQKLLLGCLMKKSKKQFNPRRKQPVFKCVKGILRIFLRKPKKIINLAGELNPRSIILANHSAKSGPLHLELYFPIHYYLWGAGEMLGSYKERFHYLRDIFYMQKRGFNKFRATISATFEAIFSPLVYKGMRVLPTYVNGRLLGTINKSMQVLNADASIMIFPENSNDGYFDELIQFFPGFVLLSQIYYKKTGEDVPIYPVYYHIKKRILCIGKPCYVQEYIQQGLNRSQIAEILKDKVNDLYHEYCSDEVKK